MKVDITGIDKGVLLARLFNGSQAMGMGVLQAGRGPSVMTDDYGRELVKATLDGEFAHDNAMMFPAIKRLEPNLYFDYLYGRPLKINITGDEVDSWGYDRDNGGDGTLQAIVDKIRSEM